jgi:hypothetical protein
MLAGARVSSYCAKYHTAQDSTLLLKRTFAAAILLLATFSAQAYAQPEKESSQSFEQTTLDRENELWKSFLGPQFNVPMFEPWLADDFLGIDHSGKVISKEQTIALLKHCTFFSYQITQPQVRSLSPTSYAFIYQITIEDSCNGSRRASGGGLVADIWKQHDNKWLLQVHTETNLPSNK